MYRTILPRLSKFAGVRCLRSTVTSNVCSRCKISRTKPSESRMPFWRNDCSSSATSFSGLPKMVVVVQPIDHDLPHGGVIHEVAFLGSS